MWSHILFIFWLSISVIVYSGPSDGKTLRLLSGLSHGKHFDLIYQGKHRKSELITT